MSKDVEELKPIVQGIADDIERLVLTASEAGVFHREDGKATGGDSELGEILDLIRDCRQETRRAEGDIDEAVRTIREAEIRLHDAVMRRTPWWRLKRLHRFYLFLYQAVVFALLVYLGLGARWSGDWIPVFVTLPTDLEIWNVPIAAAGFGAMGAVLRSMWWLYRKVQRGEYYARFLYSHLCAPWIGSILGVLVYLVIAGGLLSLGAESDPDGPAPYALALVAGFSWDSAVSLMSRLADRFGGGDSDAGSRPSSPTARGEDGSDNAETESQDQEDQDERGEASEDDETAAEGEEGTTEIEEINEAGSDEEDRAPDDDELGP